MPLIARHFSKLTGKREACQSGRLKGSGQAVLFGAPLQIGPEVLARA
jgi:hypothetical protein